MVGGKWRGVRGLGPWQSYQQTVLWLFSLAHVLLGGRHDRAVAGGGSTAEARDGTRAAADGPARARKPLHEEAGALPLRASEVVFPALRVSSAALLLPDVAPRGGVPLRGDATPPPVGFAVRQEARRMRGRELPGGVRGDSVPCHRSAPGRRAVRAHQGP